MSKTVTIRGDEWSEDELRELASRPIRDVPVKDEYGRRARLTVRVWQAQHGEGDEPDEETESAPEPTPAPEPEAEPASKLGTKTEAPYIYAHPCPRCGDPVKGGRKDKLCDFCRAKSRNEQVVRWKAKKRVQKNAPAEECDGDGDTVNASIAMTIGTLALRLRRAVYAGDATTYRSTVDALADLDKVIAATGGWKEDK